MGGLNGIATAEIPSRHVTFASRAVKAGDGDHDEILNEISIMMKPQCLLSTLAAGIFLFVW